MTRYITFAAWIALLVLAATRFAASNLQVWGASLDVAHFLFFAILARQMFCLMAGVRSMTRRAFAAFAGAVLAAIMVEWIQPWIGQERDISDVWTGAAGSATSILVGLTHRQSGRRVQIVLMLAGIAITVIALWMPCQNLAARISSRNGFPVIASFETAGEMELWETRGCIIRRKRVHAMHGLYSCEIEPTGEEVYPGMSLAVWPRNWLEYGELCLGITKTSDVSVAFWIRLDDRPDADYNERFQRRWMLERGVSEICIELGEEAITPSGRPLDRTQILRLTLFFEDPAPGSRFHVDYIRLR